MNILSCEWHQILFRGLQVHEVQWMLMPFLVVSIQKLHRGWSVWMHESPVALLWHYSLLFTFTMAKTNYFLLSIQAIWIFDCCNSVSYVCRWIYMDHVYMYELSMNCIFFIKINRPKCYAKSSTIAGCVMINMYTSPAMCPVATGPFCQRWVLLATGMQGGSI